MSPTGIDVILTWFAMFLLLTAFYTIRNGQPGLTWSDIVHAPSTANP